MPSERPTFPEMVVLSVSGAEAFVAGPEDVCISIRSPGAEPARLSANFRDVLRLYFHDLATFDRVPDGAVPFTDEMAAAVVAFAERHRAARRLVVHCEAGASRSVAVAIALAKRFTGRWWCPPHIPAEYRRARYIHNRQVYDAVCASVPVTASAGTGQREGENAES